MMIIKGSAYCDAAIPLGYGTCKPDCEKRACVEMQVLFSTFFSFSRLNLLLCSAKLVNYGILFGC